MTHACPSPQDQGTIPVMGYQQPLNTSVNLPRCGAIPIPPEELVCRTELLEMLKIVGKIRVIDLDSHYCKGPTFQFAKNFQYSPNLPRYSWKTNPSEFISEFLDITCCYSDNLGLRMHLFRQLLEGAAKIWFNAQPRELIITFRVLSRNLRRISLPKLSTSLLGQIWQKWKWNLTKSLLPSWIVGRKLTGYLVLLCPSHKWYKWLLPIPFAGFWPFLRLINVLPWFNSIKRVLRCNKLFMMKL